MSCIWCLASNENEPTVVNNKQTELLLSTNKSTVHQINTVVWMAKYEVI